MGNIRPSINLNAVKERLETLKKSKKNSNLTWKPNEKEQTVRIVPYKYQPDNPFIELYFHYNLNGKTYLSPISFGEPDPIMEVAQQLKNAGDKESWKQGKQLEPKLRTFAPVIVRGREQEGVKFWGFGKTIYEELLSNIVDPECGNVSDPVLGRDIVVYTVKEDGKDFATPRMRIKMTQTKVTEDPAILQKIVKEQPDIKELYDLKSYEELEEALDRFIHPEKYKDEKKESDAKDETIKVKEEPKAETTKVKEEPKAEPKAESAVTNPTDIQGAFDELFEENK